MGDIHDNGGNSIPLLKTVKTMSPVVLQYFRLVLVSKYPLKGLGLV